MKKFIICLSLILIMGSMYGCGKEKDDELMDTQEMQGHTENPSCGGDIQSGI